MSEFKFACPVCGQHITATGGSSGTQIECPTCFQKIVVPQPRAADSKLILNAAQPSKPRPPQAALQETARRPRSRAPAMGTLFLLLLLAGAVAGLYYFRDEFGFGNRVSSMATNSLSNARSNSNGPVDNIVWTANLAQAVVPNSKVAGELRGQVFRMSRATLQGGNLSVRQGKGSPPELAVSVIFPAKHGEDLSGKNVNVVPDQPPPRPRVVLRWKNEQGKGVSKGFPTGYALRVDFGQASGGRMPGKLYLALPDADRSVIAGTFDAEIRVPQPRRRTTPEPTQNAR